MDIRATGCIGPGSIGRSVKGSFMCPSDIYLKVRGFHFFGR